MYDCIIAGCGFAGAVCARTLAEEAGLRVLILEKRDHIAGNMYDFADENGVTVHRYGPHIFHTKDEAVFNYLKRFSDFYPYEHRVLGRIDGELVPIPFNFRSMEILFGEKDASGLRAALSSEFPGRKKVSVLELLDKGGEIGGLGRFVYDKVFKNYTAKQWGTSPDALDRSVINRVPVVLSYDDRYFDDAIQFMPAAGYTPLFKRMLTHKNITLELGCDALSRLSFDEASGSVFFDGKPFSGPVIYTGPADELPGFTPGSLPYRSLDMVFERLPITQFQPASVVNYPNEEDFTRITEFKFLTRGESLPGTTIMREYPMPYSRAAEKGNIPYYPILNPENTALYECGRAGASTFKNLFLAGRLAEYKYYNMDGAVARAFAVAKEAGEYAKNQRAL